MVASRSPGFLWNALTFKTHNQFSLEGKFSDKSSQRTALHKHNFKQRDTLVLCGWSEDNTRHFFKDWRNGTQDLKGEADVFLLSDANRSPKKMDFRTHVATEVVKIPCARWLLQFKP